MLGQLLNTISILGHWGYLIIFLAAFLESSAFMGLLVPGESVVVLSGFLSSQGYLELGDCLWVIALGAVLGDSVGYGLGKVIGRGYFERHKRLFFLELKHLQKVDIYFQRHGGKTIFFGRFIGLLRAMVPFAAGMSRMPYRRFVFYNVAGGILWAVSFTLLGYFFGQSWQLIENLSGKAGVFILFILLIAAGFAYLYRTLVRKRAEFSEWFLDKYMAFISSPHVKGFIKRHPALVAFIKERLSPAGYLGLHFTVGIAISAVFIWIFAGITEDILTGDPFVVVDRWVISHVLYFRVPLVTDIMKAITQLGGGVLIIIGSLPVLVYLSIKKRFDYLICYTTAIVGGSLLSFVLKIAIHRTRPLGGYWSFPSGHAMVFIIFYGITTYFIIQSLYSWKLRVLVMTVAGFIVFLIGLSRIYLQAHYLSDVLAGFAGGLFWLTICITGLEVYKKKKLWQNNGIYT